MLNEKENELLNRLANIWPKSLSYRDRRVPLLAEFALHALSGIELQDEQRKELNKENPLLTEFYDFFYKEGKSNPERKAENVHFSFAPEITLEKAIESVIEMWNAKGEQIWPDPEWIAKNRKKYTL